MRKRDPSGVILVFKTLIRFVRSQMDPLRRVPASIKIALAKRMRHQATILERQAWALLRDRGALGMKFRRQHVIAGFIADFVCLGTKLIVEVDGRHHGDNHQLEYDTHRTAILAAAGWRVVRVRAADLTRERLELILRPYAFAIDTRPAFPLSRRERG